MLVLALDTATEAAGVCLATPDGVQASATLSRPRAHAAFLTPAVRFCCEQAGVGPTEVDGVAVATGPGLYTGLRVGIAAAQAFAHARGIPVVGRGTLDLIAYPYRHVRADRVLVAVLDARRREVFWARYRPTGDGVLALGRAEVGPPDRLAAELAAEAEPVLCVGEGAARHRAVLQAARAHVAAPFGVQPSATALAELALPALARGEGVGPGGLRPLYLRAADATIGWDARRGRRGVPGPAGPADPEGATGATAPAAGHPGQVEP